MNEPDLYDFARIQQAFSKGASRVTSACEELTEVFAGVTAQLATVAGRSVDAVSRAELKPRTVTDLTELVERLHTRGVGALSLRERRALIGATGRLHMAELARLLEASPSLARYAARVCFTFWPQYVREPWGEAYYAVLRAHSATLAGLIKSARFSVPQLLARTEPGAETLLVGELPARGITDAYDRLKLDLGVRDSWLLASEVMSAWLAAQQKHGLPLDESLAQLLAHERLSALLLPGSKNARGGAVRTSLRTHAQTVSAFLAAAYAPNPTLSRGALSTLTDRLLKSTFDDPRSPLLSDGWQEVRKLNQQGFRRLLSSLCEQDLEVFFKHAMHEPDRHKFWLRYLSEIERTGCVLDPELRKRLERKLAAVPELQGALTRAHRYRAASHAQAFYIVFSKLVVVEFSHTANAAYVYDRNYFERSLERQIRAGEVSGVTDLKEQERTKYRIIHHARWQSETAEWLAAQGLHSRVSR